jgi:hypothetical protein
MELLKLTEPQLLVSLQEMLIQFKVPINMVGVSLHQGQKTSKLIMLNSVTLLIWQITNMLLLRLVQIVLPTGH